MNLIAENFATSSLPVAALFFAFSGSFFFLFYRHEMRDPDPIFDMPLLRSTPFLAANLYNLMLGAGILGIFAFIPLYATSVHKLSTLMSGVILTPRSLMVIAAAFATSFLLKRWGYRWPMIVGTILISVSTILLGDRHFLVFRMLGIHLGAAETLAILMMVTGTGMGMAFPASNNACIELMPEKVSTITGLRGMFRAVGGAFGISLITIILHTSPTPAVGFEITFILFGLGLLCAIPLVFLMPSGKRRTDRA